MDYSRGDEKRTRGVTRRTFICGIGGAAGLWTTGVLLFETWKIPSLCITPFGDLGEEEARRRLEAYEAGVKAGIEVEGITGKESEFLKGVQTEGAVLEECRRIDEKKGRLLLGAAFSVMVGIFGSTGVLLDVCQETNKRRERKKVGFSSEDPKF